MTVEPYSYRSDDYGRVLIAQGEWNDQLESALKKRGVTGLELNYALGFKGKDIGFLSRLTHLRSFYLTHRTFDDISVVQELGELRQLTLNTYAKSAVDFSHFPKLESLSFEWIKSSHGLFDCTKLKKLFVNKLPEENLHCVEKLERLEELRLYNAPLESVDGIHVLAELRHLEFARCQRLSPLRGIEHLSNLEQLRLEECGRIHSLEVVSNLTNLRRFSVVDCGDVDSLKPLRDLLKLEWVIFFGTTNIVDGDLSVLLQLPRLNKLAFMERAHYSHKRRDFGNLAGE